MMLDLGSAPTIKRVKDAIVHLLAQEFPLSVQGIRRGVYQRFSLRVSYQAIHKEVQKLLDRHVLVKSERGFALSVTWIRSQRLFFRYAQQNYEGVACETTPEPPHSLRELQLLMTEFWQ